MAAPGRLYQSYLGAGPGKNGKLEVCSSNDLEPGDGMQLRARMEDLSGEAEGNRKKQRMHGSLFIKGGWTERTSRPKTYGRSTTLSGSRSLTKTTSGQLPLRDDRGAMTRSWNCTARPGRRARPPWSATRKDMENLGRSGGAHRDLGRARRNTSRRSRSGTPVHRGVRPAFRTAEDRRGPHPALQRQHRAAGQAHAGTWDHVAGRHAFVRPLPGRVASAWALAAI